MSKRCSTQAATPAPPVSGIERTPPVAVAGAAALLLLFASPASRLEAHPAHAQPVNYPYVVGFERFHSSLDDADRLAEGGLLLLNELNCVACHEPPEPWRERLSGRLGTELRGVASRLDPIDLEIMIRNPRFLKRDTLMPSLFAGPDRDLEEVQALKHFLLSLTAELPETPSGDPENGRRLYHRVGCAACHSPEVGYRPETLPEGIDIELAGLPSVPMNLADRYREDALVAFLLDPVAHRPAGRMPDFGLSETEAADLAAYLKIEGEIPWPLDLARAFEQDPPPENADPALHARGQTLFHEKQCVACHQLPDGSEEPGRLPARPLAALDAGIDAGCFAERPPGGRVPFYGLDAVQKRALALAFARLREPPANAPGDELEWRFKQLNCYACHSRDGRGGPEVPREIYFGSESAAAAAWGRRGHLPPALDGAGARLDPTWMERLLRAEGDGIRNPHARPWLSARMPRYDDALVAPLLELLPALDEAPPRAEDGTVGAVEPLPPREALALLRSRACFDCHPEPGGGAGEASGGAPRPGIDLWLTPRRLTAGAFEKALLSPKEKPGGGAPEAPPFLDTPEERALIRALWRSLSEPPP